MSSTATGRSRSSHHHHHHHVLVFRHCVRSTNKRETLHNNWTAFVTHSEPDYEPQDFLAESYSSWNTPEYWCTQAGVDTMEGSGRFLFHQLVEDFIINSTADDGDEGNENNDTPQQPPSPAPLSIEFQILVDESQRDLDTAFALINGLRQAANSYNNDNDNDNGQQRTTIKIRLKGLHRLTLASWIFQPFRDHDSICDNKQKDTTEIGSLFRDRLRKEIQHRLNTVPQPEPGLLYTLSKIERRGGRGRLGSIQKVPTWIMGSGEELPDTPFINTSSMFPVVVSEQEMYLAGPINLVKWMAEMAFFTRAGDVEVPFLWNVTISELYKLVEWVHWERTILSMENSQVASKGVVLSRAIIGALKDGSVRGVTNSDDEEDCHYFSSTSCCCSESDNHEAARSEAAEAATKVTLIVGHDGDMDAIATALGLRWRLERPYHTSPANKHGQYVPTPPGSAMHFALDVESGQLDQSFWYPVLVEHFENNDNSTTTRRIPKGMRRNGTGVLEQVPLIIKPRTDAIQRAMHSELSADGKRMILLESSGIETLEAQLQATLQEFPDTNDCYQAYISRNQHVHQDQPLLTAGNCSSNSCCQTRTMNPATISTDGSTATVMQALLVGMLLGFILLVAGWKCWISGRASFWPCWHRRQQHQERHHPARQTSLAVEVVVASSSKNNGGYTKVAGSSRGEIEQPSSKKKEKDERGDAVDLIYA